MAKILLITCLTVLCYTVTTAHPDLSLGYRYRPGHYSSGAGLLQTPAYYDHDHTSYGPQPAGFPQNNYYDSSDHGSIDSTGFTESHINNGDHSPLVNKHYYSFAAPEDHEENNVVRYINIGRPQKNYRVVFIKTPSSTVSKAKIIANVAPSAEKTAIYVLSKKTNELDLNTEVVTPAPELSKPEVFFIKYKSAEEATHLQQSIQSQFDSLGGTSVTSGESPVPVLSTSGNKESHGHHHHPIKQGSRTYIPPPGHK